MTARLTILSILLSTSLLLPTSARATTRHAGDLHAFNTDSSTVSVRSQDDSVTVTFKIRKRHSRDARDIEGLLFFSPAGAPGLVLEPLVGYRWGNANLKRQDSTYLCYEVRYPVPRWAQWGTYVPLLVIKYPGEGPASPARCWQYITPGGNALDYDIRKVCRPPVFFRSHISRVQFTIAEGNGAGNAFGGDGSVPRIANSVVRVRGDGPWSTSHASVAVSGGSGVVSFEIEAYDAGRAGVLGGELAIVPAGGVLGGTGTRYFPFTQRMAIRDEDCSAGTDCRWTTFRWNIVLPQDHPNGEWDVWLTKLSDHVRNTGGVIDNPPRKVASLQVSGGGAGGPSAGFAARASYPESRIDEEVVRHPLPNKLIHKVSIRDCYDMHGSQPIVRGSEGLRVLDLTRPANTNLAPGDEIPFQFTLQGTDTSGSAKLFLCPLSSLPARDGYVVLPTVALLTLDPVQSNGNTIFRGTYRILDTMPEGVYELCLRIQRAGSLHERKQTIFCSTAKAFSTSPLPTAHIVRIIRNDGETPPPPPPPPAGPDGNPLYSGGWTPSLSNYRVDAQSRFERLLWGPRDFALHVLPESPLYIYAWIERMLPQGKPWAEFSVMVDGQLRHLVIDESTPKTKSDQRTTFLFPGQGTSSGTHGAARISNLKIYNYLTEAPSHWEANAPNLPPPTWELEWEGPRFVIFAPDDLEGSISFPAEEDETFIVESSQDGYQDWVQIDEISAEPDGFASYATPFFSSEFFRVIDGESGLPIGSPMGSRQIDLPANARSQFCIDLVGDRLASGRLLLAQERSITSHTNAFSSLAQGDRPLLFRMLSGPSSGFVSPVTEISHSTISVRDAFSTAPEPGDHFELSFARTLPELFGDVASLKLQPGASPAEADTVTVFGTDGATKRYFYLDGPFGTGWRLVGDLSFAEQDRVPLSFLDTLVVQRGPGPDRTISFSGFLPSTPITQILQKRFNHVARVAPQPGGLGSSFLDQIADLNPVIWLPRDSGQYLQVVHDPGQGWMSLPFFEPADDLDLPSSFVVELAPQPEPSTVEWIPLPVFE